MVAVTVILAVVLGWALFCHWLLQNPRGDVATGLLYRTIQICARFIHRIHVTGGEHIPDDRYPGPMLVIANHTAGVDPLLIQAACPFEIKWMMAQDQRHPRLERFWRWAGVIMVNRYDSEITSAREAIRYISSGGVIGIFPEGGMERPAGQIMPFFGGVGLIIRRTRAPVLPIFIHGTPDVDPAVRSVYTPSQAKIEVMPPVKYDRDLKPDEITEDLRRRFIEWSGWPANDSPKPLSELLEQY